MIIQWVSNFKLLDFNFNWGGGGGGYNSIRRVWKFQNFHLLNLKYRNYISKISSNHVLIKKNYNDEAINKLLFM